MEKKKRFIIFGQEQLKQQGRKRLKTSFTKATTTVKNDKLFLLTPDYRLLIRHFDLYIG
jgi:hypothetical protein